MRNTAILSPLSRARDAVEKIPYTVLAVFLRLGIGAIFLRSGMTKVNGFTVTDSTIFLFADEYRVPLVPPAFAAHLAAYAEHLFPLLLFLGLATRFSALGLLGMTAVIELFVYPELWPDHVLWAGALLMLLSRGPGNLSVDHLIARRYS
jgi:putative oxidoreductase